MYDRGVARTTQGISGVSSGLTGVNLGNAIKQSTSSGGYSNSAAVGMADTAQGVAMDPAMQAWYESYAQRQNDFNSAQAKQQMDFQAAQAVLNRDFNAAEAAKNRDWQEMMSNTAHQREVRDLIAAGLNPVLSASGGNGATVGSGATASMQQSPSGAKTSADDTVGKAVMQMWSAMLQGQFQLQAASISAGAAAAAAQIYAQNNLELKALDLAWQREKLGKEQSFSDKQKNEHPTTVVGFVNERLNDLLGVSSSPTYGTLASAIGSLLSPAVMAFKNMPKFKNSSDSWKYYHQNY